VRFLFRAFVLLVLALPFLAVAAIAMCLQDQPLVTGAVQLTPQDIEQAKRVAMAQGPRKAAKDGLHTATLAEQDLALALNYLVSRHGQGAVRIALRSGTASLQASVELPRNPIGRYLNVDASLRETEAAPRFDHLKIGRLPVPAVAADLLLREALR